MRNTAFLACILGLTAFAAADVVAQVTSPKIILSNTSGVEIPLETGSTVEFLANGDVSARCRLATDGSCPSVGSGGSTGTNPPTGVSLTPNSTSIVASTSNNLTLTWTSSTSTQVCYGAGPTGVTGWSNAALARTGNRNVALSTPGSYTFQIRCYNEGGSTLVSAATVTVTESTGGGGGGTGTDFCQEYLNTYYNGIAPVSPQFNAHGFQKVETTFLDAFGVNIGVSSQVVGLPGAQMDPSTSRYLAIGYSMPSSTASFNIGFTDAQGHGIAQGVVSVTVSPCPGDFRPQQSGTGDPYLGFQCRFQGNEPGLNATFNAAASGAGGCLSPAGKKMYINIATYDMYKSTPGPKTCVSGTSTCGVAFQVQSGTQ